MWLCKDKLKGKTAHFRLPAECRVMSGTSVNELDTSSYVT